jgi:ABC-type transport system involved in multi-copper enzyme maturation permease subunit
VSQARVVTWLAVRELWITFRLVIVLLALVVVGAIVALMPAPLPLTMQRLAIGMGAASLVVAAAAAWSVAEERQQGRAGWLVTRSVPRRTLLGGWFVALSAIALAGTIATGILGWLAASGVSLRLDPAAYAVRFGAVAATVVAVVALGVLAGTLGRPRVAALLALFVAAGIGLVAWLVPAAPDVMPGAAYVELAALVEGTSSDVVAWQSAGIALVAAAALLWLARLTLERADL